MADFIISDIKLNVSGNVLLIIITDLSFPSLVFSQTRK
jgi:hypothetical protein